MVNARHSRYTVNQGIHGFISFEYANEAARLAATGFISEDKYKAAIETDSKNIYVITDVSGGLATWADIHTFGGGGVAEQGAILYFDGANWVTLDPSDDGYVLTIHGENENPTWEPPAGGGGVAVSAGAQSISSGTVIFSNSNGVSFGMNASTITASHHINVSAGTTSNNLSALVFNNANNVSFGLDASTITAIVTVPAQTNQTVGLYAVGNTTQNSSTILDARTLSFNGIGAATMGFSNGSIQVSVPVQTVQTQSIIQAVYDGANSISSGTIRFTNANGVSFSINGQTISGSVLAQTNQTLGLYAVSNTTGESSSSTFDARTLSFHGAGIASVGYSNGSVVVSVPVGGGADGVNIIAAGTQTANTTGTVMLSNSNNISFGMNNSSLVTASYNFNWSAGTTSNNLNSISFSNGSGVSFGLNAGTLTASVSQTVQTQSIIQAIYDGANSISTGTIRFTNANGVSFSINGQTISASVSQTNQTVGLYALGNTTQNSSTTLDARTISYNGLGAMTVGYSNGSVQLSAPPTSQISVTGALSISINASTISLGVSNNIVSNLLWPPNPWQTNFAMSNGGFSLQHFNPPSNITVSQINLLLSLSGNTNSSGALTISIGAYTMSQSTMSLASSSSVQITWTSGTDTSASSRYGGVSGVRYRTISLNNWPIAPGDYMIGVWFRTTNDGTWRAHGQQGPTIVGALNSGETQHYHHGFSTSSFTTAMPASINVTNTNYVRTGVEALQQPGFIYIGSI